MFTNLLESRGKKPRSGGGTVVSFTAHAALIVFAIHATLHAGQTVEAPPDKVVFAAEPADKPLPLKRTTPSTDVKPPTNGILTLKDVVNVPDQLPDVELSTRSTKDSDWLGNAVPDGRPIRMFDGAPVAGGIYLASQVDEPVMAAPGMPGPRYPEVLRAAGVQGEVVVTFVVDTTGHADPASFVILRETDAAFGSAVRNALSAMRFIPAKAGGRKVKQQVQQPFVFTIVK